jgi:hypothetical protein
MPEGDLLIIVWRHFWAGNAGCEESAALLSAQNLSENIPSISILYPNFCSSDVTGTRFSLFSESENPARSHRDSCQPRRATSGFFGFLLENYSN